MTGFDAKSKTLTFDKPQPDNWYTPRQGNEYVLMGLRHALDAEGEWWLDRQARALWLKPPGGRDPNGLKIEAKRRRYTIDLSGRAHLRLAGIHFRAGGILTDADSHHLLLENLNGQYLGHSDHCSHNAIVHHNVVWNMPGMPLQVNNPSYFMLCYNNTLWRSGGISTFDHSHRDDMFGCRFQNNILAQPFRLPPHVVTQPNLIDPNPSLADPEQRRVELTASSPARGRGVPLPGIAEGAADRPPDLGAEPPPWRAGHDFQNPPEVQWDVPEAAFSNAIRNARGGACFRSRWRPLVRHGRLEADAVRGRSSNARNAAFELEHSITDPPIGALG